MKRCAWIAIIMLCLSACSQSSKHFDVDRSRYPVKGIDVSAHNGAIDFGRVAADSVQFVFIKATEGNDFCDAMFARNHDAARAAGLKVGAYHFFRFKTPGHIQAYHFLSTIAGRHLDLPLAIDVEEWKNDEGVADEEVADQLRSMLQVLASNGFPVIIYTNKRGYERYIQGNFDDVPLWLSSLSGPPGPGWAVWQHSHSGRVKGIASKVDIDTFNGTADDFAAWLVDSIPHSYQPSITNQP